MNKKQYLEKIGGKWLFVLFMFLFWIIPTLVCFVYARYDASAGFAFTDFLFTFGVYVTLTIFESD